MNKNNTNTLQNLMGESCEEGGPSSSHKIPRKMKKTKKECSEQSFIHLSNMFNYNIEDEHALSL